jgi:tetratricopeptide (TPR) repeat protein
MKMNKGGFAVLGLLLFFCLGTTQLAAVEGETQEESEFVRALLNNQYLLENARLLALADESYAQGKYDDAIKFAQEAIKFALLSDEYVSMQIKIRDANNAIAEAQTRIEWVNASGNSKRYEEAYGQAEIAFNGALDARSKENWDQALEKALLVMVLLSEIPETPVLPAQYLVKTWASVKDCLWNIAAKPQVYDNPWEWRRLYDANKAIMPKADDPDLIHPGMILNIPSIRGETRSGIMEAE